VSPLPAAQCARPQLSVPPACDGGESTGLRAQMHWKAAAFPSLPAQWRHGRLRIPTAARQLRIQTGFPAPREGESTLLGLYRPGREKPWNQRPRRPRHAVSAPSAAREAGCARQASSDALTHPATRLLRLRLDAERGAVRRYAALPRGASLAAALCLRARRSTTGSPGASRPRCIARRPVAPAPTRGARPRGGLTAISRIRLDVGQARAPTDGPVPRPPSQSALGRVERSVGGSGV